MSIFQSERPREGRTAKTRGTLRHCRVHASCMQIRRDKNWSTSGTRWISGANQRVSLTPAPVEQCLSVWRQGVPLLWARVAQAERPRNAVRAACRERENHCIPIDPRVNEAVEWWPLTGAFTGLRIIPRKSCLQVFSRACPSIYSPSLFSRSLSLSLFRLFQHSPPYSSLSSSLLDAPSSSESLPPRRGENELAHIRPYYPSIRAAIANCP